ncbi:hypothetical protein [Glycomyces lechevalierae]|uniref:Uncharacterized protein n=1 Tax=Glycomyces lechevalierae TaxID=256034 RepID=A0A9X3PF20_9ACTN|nr:hypothetical protein [Glycomyces lechevalierae]MDA1384085.1 hypothetical protein [Glycomyces lechevalierae]MDR7339486.1 hypothetical protein [Glycomyces lechevalierae]
MPELAPPDSGTPDSGAPEPAPSFEAAPDGGPDEYEAAAPGEVEPEEDDYAPMAMPLEGRLVTAVLWLLATALCAGFVVTAAILAFDLASVDVPSDQIARSAGYCAALGTATVLHVVLALHLRWQRGWARKGVVALEAGAITFCVYLAADPLLPGADVPVLSSGHGLLGIALHVLAIMGVSTAAMRAWCASDGARERPGLEGPGRSRLLR